MDPPVPASEGIWQWDDKHKKLQFKPRENVVTSKTQMSIKTRARDRTNEIVFKENLDNMEKIKFKRHFMRKSAISDVSAVVTLQDCKDIVIYMGNPISFSPNFIRFIHTISMDNFFRAVIVYFQYFLQVIEIMTALREEAQRKLWHPNLVKRQDKIRRDLADLRAVVMREYATILKGTGGTKQFHHVRGSVSGISETDKDKRQMELLLKVTARVVWCALYKKNFPFIEQEINRMFRSSYFCKHLHGANAKNQQVTKTPEERYMLYGKSDQQERKLNQRSPLMNELILVDHDYQIMGINLHSYEPTSERVLFLQKAYKLPEKMINYTTLPLGILGIPRKYMDLSLSFRDKRLAQRFQQRRLTLPPSEMVEVKGNDGPFPMMPTTKPMYRLNAKYNEERLFQKNQWIMFIEKKRMQLSMGNRRSTIYSLTEHDVVADIRAEKVVVNSSIIL